MHYVTLRYVTLRYVALRCVALRYLTLRYVRSRYVTLCYITSHYITLHIVGVQQWVLLNLLFFFVVTGKGLHQKLNGQTFLEWVDTSESDSYENHGVPMVILLESQHIRFAMAPWNSGIRVAYISTKSCGTAFICSHLGFAKAGSLGGCRSKPGHPSHLHRSPRNRGKRSKQRPHQPVHQNLW